MKVPKMFKKKDDGFKEPKYEQKVGEEVEENKVPEEETKKKNRKIVGEEVEENKVPEEETKKKNRKIVVVRDLPTQPVREVELEDGTIADLITTEEAMTKLFEEDKE